MGIFDRSAKKPDKQPAPAGQAAAEAGDFADSPVETVALGGAPVSAARPAPPPPEPVEERPHYGIAEAIQLMRALPVDQNVELVVQVIKTTLESLKVRVSDIIEDAAKKQHDIESRVTNLKAAIVDLEKEIQTRKEEIARLEADHSETSAVRARLELAEKAQAQGKAR